MLNSDDLAILAPNVSTLLQILTSVDLFCHENGLQINIDKTQYMLQNCIGDITIHGQPITQVKSFKCLGFHLCASIMQATD